MVAAQGGDPDALEGGLRGAGCVVVEVKALRSGVVVGLDAREVGRAAFGLGAGRLRAEDPVDFGVGIVLEVAPGDVVAPGRVLARVLHRDGRGLEEAVARLGAGVVVGDGPAALPPLVHEVVSR